MIALFSALRHNPKILHRGGAYLTAIPDNFETRMEDALEGRVQLQERSKERWEGFAG